MSAVGRLRAAWRDRPAVRFCDACAAVQVCDTACRAAAARDRAVALGHGLTGPR
ncbi:hypothetical protein [Nakamurella sp.]|uniref:hypothetical protein n=1 Tax=Nakamurella sp. TaxID=1869182 RepID=UPI003B3AD568